MGFKLASQLITKIWTLVYGQWIHCSILKHAGKELENHTKELITNAKIKDKHKQGQYTLTYCYNQFFVTPLSTILDTLLTVTNIYRLIKTAR